MNTKEKIFKISILLITAFLLFVFYLLITDHIQTQKLYPWNIVWLRYGVWQKYASADCFRIEPNYLTFHGKEGVLEVNTGFMKNCNFTHAYLWFHISDSDFFKVSNTNNLTIKRRGNQSEKGRIGYIINSSDMEPFERYDFDIYFKLNNNLYNYFDLSAEGSKIDGIVINYDDSLNGYKCDDQDCFNVIEGTIKKEKPIWRGHVKEYSFDHLGRILIRFSPKSNFWNFVLKLFDTFILGSVAIILFEILNIIILSSTSLKSNRNYASKPNKSKSIKEGFNMKLSLSKWIIIIVFMVLTWITFGYVWGITIALVLVLYSYYRQRYPLNKKEEKANENHFMNYTYSYFGGIFAAMAIAFILGQNPLKLPWRAVLSFLLITFGAGLVCCTLIKSVFIINKKCRRK